MFLLAIHPLQFPCRMQTEGASGVEVLLALGPLLGSSPAQSFGVASTASHRFSPTLRYQQYNSAVSICVHLIEEYRKTNYEGEAAQTMDDNSPDKASDRSVYIINTFIPRHRAHGYL